MDWQPTATINTLQKRAEILHKIRVFFAERTVLEVETPLLSHAGVTDPHIHSISATVFGKKYYLQTSPEYAMKRLLAAGSGSIYQICKAFRHDETSLLHNPEFTMLEWYRVNFTHHDLMNEMDELLQIILKTPAAERLSYMAAFEKYAGINPHLATKKELQQCAQKNNIDFRGEELDETGWLDLLMTHCIQPRMQHDRPVFLYDFPVPQSALAKIRDENPPVASRFEVYFKGIELANGFHELQDAKEQRARFEKNNVYRQHQQMEIIPIDENFLAALEHGLPDCAGVALGVDRLVMLALEKDSIDAVMGFSAVNIE